MPKVHKEALDHKDRKALKDLLVQHFHFPVAL
jgi:hypothetical protein